MSKQTFKGALNSWAHGADLTAKAREAVEIRATGAYAHLTLAASLFVEENGTGPDAAKAFRTAIADQQANVWAKNPTRYGRILKDSTDKDGNASVVLTGSAMNAISVTRGGIEHGVIESGMSFGAVKTAVAAAKAAANADETDPALPGLVEEFNAQIKALRAAVRKMDDSADVADVLKTVKAAAAGAEKINERNAQSEKTGNKTGQQADAAELEKAAKATGRKTRRAKAKAAA